MKKYLGEPVIVEKELHRVFKKSDFLFFEDMGDAYAAFVPKAMVLRCLKYADLFPDTMFLSCTKNPKRFVELIEDGYSFPKHHILGCTVETNRDMPSLSKAPLKSIRLEWLNRLNVFVRGRIFLSVEPIVDFDTPLFVQQILQLIPWAVAVGYNNYDCKDHHLPEPSLAKVQKFIKLLEDAGVTVYRKTIRKAWWEK
jgi:protein gp37